MKEIRKTVANVFSLDYDSESDCIIAFVDEPIIGRTALENKIRYEPCLYVHLEFVTNEEEINIGDKVSITTYLHNPGDAIKLNRTEYVFDTLGIHNIVTKL